ncbi:nitrate- and nitrite sensing domain-containing protein [Micromonospora sp. WMMD1102]|uniref:sensor histidine kinase n=1 Tax=Micromonospora sp. WMMD1102 TaxID=3016105 RepID=UPI00241533B9|nr:nitrate- and nitrite sensing domain-containing protein [Micromonospora sp. WMMD1102]MDG4784458.1 nitrate- and nitrite sensing domain-containing protein [Micromonospora sp. WMMD1102]
MSKRPKTASPILSRLRWPVAGRLRDMPIWSKLGLIMIAPTIAVVVVGTTSIVDHMETLDDANRAHTLATLAQTSGELVHDLQDERAGAVLLLGSRNDATRKAARDAYGKVHPEVDKAKGPYSERRAQLDELPGNFDTLLAQIDQGLADLPGIRSQVINSKLKLTDAAQSYEGLINDLLNIRDLASQLAGDSSLSDRMRAAAANARGKEFLSMRRVVVHRALIDGQLTAALQTDYIATETGQQQALQTFKAIATGPEAAFYDETVTGADVREVDSYGGWIRGRTNESMADAPFDADDWDSAMLGNAQLIRTVEGRLDADVLTEASALRDDVQRTVFLETGLLLSMLLLAVLFAYLVARSMARSLRELRHGALSIAQYGLPHAVSRLRDPQMTAQMSPVQVANQIAEPLPVRSKDEFGQVTEAFNAVHLEAVRTAAEQAALRASVATMFVNLARRSQILVDRLIGHLDRLERGEEDPDRLGELFQLDHLATRMRRNDENLLVLAGADSTRVQREPAALIDVLRAAQSEVEHYTRIEFGMVDRDLEVQAAAVNDLVHLVAELFDNATAFSPPDSQVMVEARRVGDRGTLFVEDRGIGITAEQLQDLNERLATPPAVDVTVSRMMGLVVVARLASRHGVRVELRPGPDRGTVAEVTLPAAMLIPRALSGRTQQPGGPIAPEPTARPAIGGPLALESGPAATPAPAFGGGGRGPGFGADPGPGFGADRGPGFGGDRAPGFGGGDRGPGFGGDRNRDGAPLGRPYEPAMNGGHTGGAPSQPREMPAWSDLTGARGAVRNGNDPFTPRVPNGHDVEPLPQRRATEQDAGPSPAETTMSGFIPRQRPATPEPQSNQPNGLAALPPAATPPPVPPVSAPPFGQPPVSAPPFGQRPVSAPPFGQTAPPPAPAQPPAAPSPAQSGNAPPAWPPVNTPDRETAAPPVPERLAAALDMTAELPRMARPSAAEATANVEARPKFADETMELPIFRELESAWFRTRRKPEETGGQPQGAPTAPQATGQAVAVDTAVPDAARIRSVPTTGNAATVDSPAPGGQQPGSGPATNSTGRPGEGSGWRTAADDGWRAAMAATTAATTPNQTTQTGLPKRVPMAQLVPGAVEKPTTSVQRRTPEAVRGLLSAYHRGVQRGRTHPTDDQSTSPEATPAGQQSPQAGVGPATASGQKEHEG